MKLKVHKISILFSWKGLLFGKPKPILFHTRFGIHTFGMKYPIDVVILDKSLVVRKIKQNLLPNRFFFWNPLLDTVIELPQGTIKKKKIQIGMKLQLQTF